MNAELVSDEALAALAENAKRIRSNRRTDLPPIVVEFAGSPKSGKSTTIDIISHFFRRSQFKVWAPSEGASKRTPTHLRTNLVAYNAWTLNYAISELLVAYYNVDQPDLVILDRGPFDSVAWMALLTERGDLTEAEFETIRAFAVHPKWASLVSRLYLFTCEPKVSLERETASKLTRRGGIAMNPGTLAQLLEKYTSLQELLEGYPVKAMITSERTTPLATAFSIAEDVLELFETQQDAPIGYE